jgi:hypothetical protein
LPYFEDPVLSEAHRIHKYVDNSSLFYAFGTASDDLPLGNSVSVARGNEAYRLVDAAQTAYPVTFGEDGSGYFALAGNPFMATIDFDALQIANSGKIKPSYQIWAGAGFSVYNKEGVSGVVDGVLLNKYIAPMQSFIVEKTATGSGNETLTFSIGSVTATNTGTSQLRSSQDHVNKLDIKASNDVATVLAYIAKREGGSEQFSDRDSRKIIASLSDVPEIYTLKESATGRIAVGGNVINNDNLLIPLGVASAYEGDITLTFTGMDNYDAYITFIDIEEHEIDITGLGTYTYVFNNQGDIAENRFFIRISSDLTAVDKISGSSITAYYSNRTIYAVSDLSDPIRRMDIYNAQGALIFSDDKINAPYYTVKNRWNNSGIYLVRLTTGQGVKSVKILVK